MEIIKPGTHIDFVGKRKYAYAVSLILVAITILALFIRGGPNYGVDFAGGVLIEVQFHQDTTAQDVRSAMADLNMAGASIQRFGAVGHNEFLIRVQDTGQELEGLTNKVHQALAQKYGQDQVDIRRVEMVGPKVGEDLRQKALFAVFYAILFILIYISGRFEMKWMMSLAVSAALMATVILLSHIGAGITWLILIALLVTLAVCFILKLQNALGAIVALIHDVSITMGIFAVLDKEITLSIVAALLTIVGYSLNDTIIVFDRIRENSRKQRKMSLAEVINQSINETLSRTILTSGTTLVVVLCLFFLGGPVIRDFALALIVGVLVGTYSSVYVASPILLLWPDQAGQKSGAPSLKGSGNKKAKA